ncbi:hypothetical protein ACFVFS_27810 [Kitasatospora sp. NPDC057692]|uniref:hypothetical protein n=1 Tax=Kitasatospora sp. NPDC057692 TaxID=3346215 RepID=UPI00369F62D9
MTLAAGLFDGGGSYGNGAAITGGVVAAHTGTADIPDAWAAAREPLPGWAFPEPDGVARASDRGFLKPLRLPRPCPVPDVVWSEEQWQRIRYGLRSKETEQKWESCTADGVLHLHRSRTGHAQWAVRVAAVPGGGRRPVSAVAQTHPGYAEAPLGADRLRDVLGLAATGYAC